MKPLRERLENAIDNRGPDKCWGWKLSKKAGCAYIQVDGINELAHRVIYQTEFGPIPKGRSVLRTCGDNFCCNPRHLTLSKTLEERFWERVEKSGPSECWLWNGYRMPLGYGMIFDGTPKGAHRVSYELAHGKITDRRNVCHRCDNPPCVNPAHLFLGTDKENFDDSFKKGRRKRGELRFGAGHPNARLTDAKAIAIRRLYKSGVSQEAIAERFGVSQANIGLIVRRETWRHVD